LLSNALDCLRAQTYQKLEIIVGDNASSDPRVRAVIESAMSSDSRIRFLRHERNLGAWANFQAVLAAAQGERFMWAGDDDRWHPSFIARMLEASAKGGGSAMSSVDIYYHKSGRKEKCLVPRLCGEPLSSVELRRYLGCMQSSLFYGLHQRSALYFIRDLPPFDWLDCYVVIRLLIEVGFTTISDCLYWAGVPGEAYVIKPANKSLNPSPFIRYCRGLIRAQKQWSLLGRLGLSATLSGIAWEHWAHGVASCGAGRLRHLQARSFGKSMIALGGSLGQPPLRADENT